MIVEDEEGNYEPISHAGTLAEGLEIAKEDLRFRMKSLEAEKDLRLCPYRYKLWARGLNGIQVAATWNVSEL